jgi:hypothetical protein
MRSQCTFQQLTGLNIRLVICVLLLCSYPRCSGSDPTKLIEDLAKRKKIKTLGVSMGQGQEIIADKLLTAAAAEGHWLLLQNTHLGLNYLTDLEGKLSKAEDLHEDFRWAWQGTSVAVLGMSPPAILLLCSLTGRGCLAV